MIPLLGTAYPIIQAPMAGVSTPELAAAVSNAGGLGSIGIGASTAENARSAVIRTRSLTDRPFNVNVFCHRRPHRDKSSEIAWIRHFSEIFENLDSPAPAELTEIYTSFSDDDESFRMVLQLRPPVVSFHFGLPPREMIAALKEAGIILLATATSLYEAMMIEAAGIDAVVAQGIEAGGHRGCFEPGNIDLKLSTFELVRILVRNASIPVIAAGGIMDGVGIKAALGFGAIAAQLGTAFILCPESSADGAYRTNLKSERSRNTRITSVISGRPARGLVNALVEHGEAESSPPPAAYPLAYDLAKKLHAAAAKKGNFEFAAHWAGKAAHLAREYPAAKVVEVLVQEALG